MCIVVQIGDAVGQAPKGGSVYMGQVEESVQLNVLYMCMTTEYSVNQNFISSANVDIPILLIVPCSIYITGV